MNEGNQIIKIRNDENYYCYDWIIKFKCMCNNCLRNFYVSSPNFTAKSFLHGYWTLNLCNLLNETSTIHLKTNVSSFNNYKLRISTRQVNKMINYSREYNNINLSEIVMETSRLLVRYYGAYFNYINFSRINNCNSYTPRGVLTLVVEIFQHVPVISTDVRNTTTIEALKNLQLSEELSDMTLVAGEREFRVHKAILAAQSSVFLAMFKHDVKETKENRVVIEDVSERVMVQVIDYIYGGTLEKENFGELASEVLIAADKYNVQGLVRVCEDAMIRSLNDDNVLKILTTAEIYKLNSLKESTLNYIVKNVKEVVETDEFKKFIDSPNHCLMKEIILAVNNK